MISASFPDRDCSVRSEMLFGSDSTTHCQYFCGLVIQVALGKCNARGWHVFAVVCC